MMKIVFRVVREIIFSAFLKKKRKSTINTIGYSSIPQDLTFEILLKLPAKSVLRFRYVSKSWRSIIDSQQFINAFMSQSLSKPRVVLAFTDHEKERMLFFSSTHHQSCSFPSSSSMLVAKENTLVMPKFRLYSDYICNLVRGFLCYGHEDGFVVCNPTTGQVIPIAELKSDNYYHWCVYMGYDPNNDHYKVLHLKSSNRHGSNIEHSVCTLGGQGSSHSWRPIKANNIPDYRCYKGNGVCIDGVVYYERQYIQNDRMAIGIFYVESEQLGHIGTPEDMSGAITNYLGKLAMYSSLDNGFDLWVLDDVKNHIWSNKSRVFPSFNSSLLRNFGFAGITASGEIVYVPVWFSDSFELHCYDVENNVERTVRVEGFSEGRGFCPWIFCSYVDNIIYL